MELKEISTKEVADQLMEWLGECKFANYKRKDCIYINEEDESVRLSLFTDNNFYSIRAKPPSENKKTGYLGGIAQSRKPRAGETWNRGNDIADGPFTREVWNQILFDIVGYELVKIQQPVKRIADEG